MHTPFPDPLVVVAFNVQSLNFPVQRSNCFEETPNTYILEVIEWLKHSMPLPTISIIVSPAGMATGNLNFVDLAFSKTGQDMEIEPGNVVISEYFPVLLSEE